MKELFRERDLTRISYYQAILEAAGIRTFVRNDNLSVTEVSIPVFFPALCVVDEADYERAAELIRTDMEAARESPGEDRTCGTCGETSPGNFDRCWNCGSALS